MIMENGCRFIWQNARLLERVVLNHHLHGPAPQSVIRALMAYQNADGGLGHALEPDLCASESQPLYVEFGLRTLYECGIRAPDLAHAACDFLSRHADLDRGIPTLLPSAKDYPRASHWESAAVYEPSLDRLVGLVGLANWQGIDHPWLRKAVSSCLDHVTALDIEDAHTIQNAFCLLESLSAQHDVSSLYSHLADALRAARFFVPQAPVREYGLTPLHFAPGPATYCRPLFTDEQIAGHLDDLETQQEADGGWSIAWEPPSEAARWAWRAHRTVGALATLRDYDRI